MTLERALDQLARKLGMDPAEVRRRNFIPPGAFPYVSATGERYDSGDYEAALDRALEMAGYQSLRDEQAVRRSRGPCVDSSHSQGRTAAARTHLDDAGRARSGYHDTR